MLDAPVLVIGSLPPHGHDLDLLLPPEQRRAVLPALGRGAVAVADSYLLDAAVEIRNRSGGRRVRLQTAMMRALSPPSRRAYLIGTGTPADAAYAEAAPLLGVRSLDGGREDEELSAQIAADVWPAVR